MKEKHEDGGEEEVMGTEGMGRKERGCERGREGVGEVVGPSTLFLCAANGPPPFVWRVAAADTRSAGRWRGGRGGRGRGSEHPVTRSACQAFCGDA